MDHTLQLTHEWVEELRDRLGWDSNRDVLRLMRAVLTEVRDRLPPPEAARLSSHMPLLIRGMFFEGWHPEATPLEDRDADAFRRAVEGKLGDLAVRRGDADIAAVFATLANRVPERDLAHVRHALPRAIRVYWPADLTWSGE